MFFAKQLYEMTHIDLGYDTDSIVKVHFERYERKQPTTEAEYLKQTSLRKASKENISTCNECLSFIHGMELLFIPL